MKNYTPVLLLYSFLYASLFFKCLTQNAASKQLIENDNYLKDRMDDEGFSLVDGVLCQTFEE